MNIRKHLNYWTVFDGVTPIRSYATFIDAWSALYRLYAGFDAP
jgi:hypothetical protein